MSEPLSKTAISPAGENPESSEPANPTPEDRKHHPYSPSTLQSREFCPAYETRQDATLHERTIAGTRAHGVTETGLDDSRLTDEDAVAAAECLDFVEQRRALMQEEAIRASDALGKVEDGPRPRPELFQVHELTELHVRVDDEKFQDCDSTTSGYFDRALLCQGTGYAEGFDWKFGRWPVENPKENLQVISYTLGIFREFPAINKVRFWVKQPALGTTKDAMFTRDEIPALYLRVQTVVARAREAHAKGDFSTAVPSVPNCSFCGALGRCPKVADFACKVGRKFHPLAIPEDINPTGLCNPKDADLGLRLVSVLKVWCDAFRRQVTDRILRGEQELPAGQKIQTMRKRELVDAAKFRTVALGYLTEAEYMATLEPTFGAVETLVQDKAPRGSKKTTVEEFQSKLLTEGAVKMGDEFSFLKAVPVKD